VLKNITLKLGDYISIQQYDDPDLRLRQIILSNFERGTLYDTTSIDRITQIMTVRNFWVDVQRICGDDASNLKRLVGDLISRRNQIAHRADRPGENEKADGHGLRPINLSWTNVRVQTAKTVVTAGADVMHGAIRRLEADIQAAREQEEARRLARQTAAMENHL